MSKALEVITDVPTENQIKNAIIQFLTIKGYLVLRVNSGAAAGEYEDKQGHTRKRFMRFVQYFAAGLTFKEGQAGVSDILAFKEGQTPLAIETKVPGKKATEAQERFMAEWVRAGGVAIVATGIQDIEVIKDEVARRGQRLT